MADYVEGKRQGKTDGSARRPKKNVEPPSNRARAVRGMGYDEGKTALSPGAPGRSQRKGPGAAAISGTYRAWVFELSKRRGVPIDDAGVVTDALSKTRSQVGEANYMEWFVAGGHLSAIPGQWRVQAPVKVEEKEEKTGSAGAADLDLSPMGLYRGMRRRVAGYVRARNAINAAVVQVEYQAQKLSSPEGAKGIAYQIAGGGLGLLAGVGARGAKAIKAGADGVKKKIDEAGLKMVGIDPGKPKKPEKSLTDDIHDRAESIGDSANTSVELLTGKLNALYQRTRPAYSAFQAAYASFDGALGAFNAADYLDLAGLSKAMDGMSGALQAMAEASLLYERTCISLGIPAKALAVDKLSAAIVEGMKDAVEISVDALGGLGGAGGEGKKRLSEKAKDYAKDRVKDAAMDKVKDGAKHLATDEIPRAIGGS